MALGINRSMIEAARASTATRMGYAADAARGATSYGSNQVQGILDFIAATFGQDDFSGFDPATQKWLRYGVSRLTQSGMIPGLYDNGQGYEAILHAMTTNQQMKGNLDDLPDVAFALSDAMQSDLFATNGTVNYSFTGGLEGDVAAQFYAQQLNEYMKAGNNITGERIALATGNTFTARHASMLENIGLMESNNEMSHAQAAQYYSAGKSVEAIGSEAAARMLGAAKRRADASKGKKSVQTAYNELANMSSAELRAELVGDNADKNAEAYREMAKKDEKSLEKAQDLFKKVGKDKADALVQDVAQHTLSDYRSGNGAKALDRAIISDNAQAEIIRGLIEDDLSTMRVGTTVDGYTYDTAKRRGSVSGYIDWLQGVPAQIEDGAKMTSGSRAKLKNIKAARDALKGAMAGTGVEFGDNEETRAHLEGMLGQDGLSKEMKEGLEGVKTILDKGKLSLSYFKDGTKEVSDNVRKSFAEYGAALKTMQETFGAKSFAELQQKARALNWGNLGSKESLDRMNQGMADVFGIAQASGRSIEQVLTERKDIVKALSALSGGARYVSEAEVSEQQIAKQYADADELAGGRYTSQERFAMMKRSHENAKELFGAADAAEQLMKASPGRFSSRTKSMLNEKIKQMDALMKSDSPTARAEARLLNAEIKTAMHQLGYDDDELRIAANKNGEGRVTASVTQGAVQQFAQKMREIEDPYTGSKFSNTTIGKMSDIMRSRLTLLGSSDTEWSKFLTAAKGDDEKFETYLKSQGFSGKNLEEARRLRSSMLGLEGGVDGMQFSLLQDASTPQTLVGDVQRARQKKAQWDARVKGSSYAQSVSSTGNIFSDMIRAATNGKQFTGADVLAADMFTKISNDARYEGGKTNAQRAAAMNDLLNERSEAWGTDARAVALEEDGTISEGSFKKLLLASGLRAGSQEYKELMRGYKNTDAELRGAYVQETMHGRGMGMEIKNGVAIFARHDVMAEQTRLSEREMNAQKSLKLKDALKGDNTVSEDELLEILKKDPSLGRIDENGIYHGALQQWEGKSVKDITGSEKSFALNYKNADGSTNAQNIMSLQETSNVSETANGLLKDILGGVTKIANWFGVDTGSDSADKQKEVPKPKGNADGSNNNG